jgi:hypothetical protein
MAYVVLILTHGKKLPKTKDVGKLPLHHPPSEDHVSSRFNAPSLGFRELCLRIGEFPFVDVEELRVLAFHVPQREV